MYIIPIDVECIREPLGFLNADGMRGEPWTRLGEVGSNLARRYSYPTPALFAEYVIGALKELRSPSCEEVVACYRSAHRLNEEGSDGNG